MAESWNKWVDRFWPVTFGIGLVMTILLLACLALSFCLVYGATFSIFCDCETWRAFDQ